MLISEKQKIMVVDDNLVSLEVTTHPLIDEGYEVVTFKDPVKAIDFLNENNVDLILLDIYMPKIDGFNFFDTISNMKKNNHIPVIFMTSSKDPRIEIQGLVMGAVDFIHKPITKEKLLSKIKNIIFRETNRYSLEKVVNNSENLKNVVLNDLADNFFKILEYLEIGMESPKRSFQILPDISYLINQSKRLVSLGYNLLHLNKSRGSYNRANVKISDCVDEAINYLESKAETKSIKINSNIEKDYEIHVDPYFFVNFCLINILNNAINFSFEGGRIEINAYKKNGKIYLCIKDEGIGIPEEQIENIFNLRDSLVREGTEGELGSGNGLKIVKNLMDDFEAEILIKSVSKLRYDNDCGTEVQLIFNFEKQKTDNYKTHDPLKLSELRILVIDDDEITLINLEKRLRKKGMEVFVSDNATNCVQSIKENRIDMVLLDVMMPKISGIDALKIIKADFETREIPIIMISSTMDSIHLAEAIKFGADDFISKPFNFELLVFRIMNILNNKTLSKG